MFIIANMLSTARHWILSWLEMHLYSHVSDVKDCIVSWVDYNTHQCANQVRYLLNEPPKGQCLPTIQEEEEEEEGSYDNAHYRPNSSAHLADNATNSTNLTEFGDKSAKGSSSFKIHAKAGQQ